MMKLSATPLGMLFVVLFVVMGVLILFCLLYGIFSRRFTDKIVAANMIGSLTLNVILMLAIYMAEDYILDISIVYALLSFLAVVVLCRTVTDHILGKMRHMKAHNPDATRSQLADAGTDRSAPAEKTSSPAEKEADK
jgi:multicomponent Na+:H+ antiporter subunit F